jgi:hypothetical protein
VNALSVIFIAAFIGGLVLAVLAMLHGVEHLRRDRSRAPSPFFNLPAIAAFAVGFGAVGYPLASRTALPVWGILVIAIASGGLAISGMITLLAQWALRGAGNTSDADAHEIQGQPAIVTRDISASSTGEIAYEYHGRRINVAARSLGAKPVATGAEVVIDRIEDGVAFVEEWAIVEQRL